MDDPRNNVGVVCPRCGVGRIEGKDETVCHRCLLMEVFGGAFDSLELGATSSRLLPDHARAIRSALRPPPVIPDHELLQRIGAGSYGEVWLARNVVGTLRAVKVVWREDLESDKPYEREFDGIRRYEPVSRQHEGLVHILHVGRDDARGCFFYIMELADNAAEPPVEPSDGPSGNLPPAAPSNGARYRPETLREVLRRRHRLPVDECIELGVTLARALEGLHEAGLVHRDIKPSNIIFVGGRAKLADIGLVTGIAEARSFVGTEGYVPHEGPGTPEADLFSLGKVLYEASTGFDRNDFPRLPRAIAATTDETTAWALPELNEIILRCCEREPKRRYRSAREVRNDLSLLQAGRSVRRLRRLERNIKLATRAGVAAGLLALLAAGAYFGSFRQIERARRAEQQARDSANRLLWRQAETRFESDLSSDGLACLAHLVRNRPQDRAAVERLLSALSWRGFTLPVAEPARPRSRVQTMVQGPGGDELWTGSYSGAVECWRLSNGTALRPPWELGGRILGLEFAPDGQRVGITAAVRAGIFGIATGDPLFPVITRPRPFRFDGLRFDPPGDRFATFSVVGWAQIWDSRTGQPIGAEMRHEEKISELRFSPDGSRVATASQDGTARLWASADGRPLTPPLRHGGRVNDVEFSPDGHYLLTASDDQSAHLWEVESGRLKGVLPHGGVVRTAAFSPDGQTIVTASEDNSAILWNAATLNPLGRPLRHRGWVTKAVFSPDGQRVLTASDDNTVRIWDAATGQPLTEPLRHGHEIDVAQFSRDGRLVVSAARDALIWIRPATPQRAQPVMLWPEGHVSAACYSPDGTRLALGGGDGSIRLVDPSAPKEPTLFQVLTQPVKALHFS
ncbi:MAG TPA: protein kinase, partial [Methylomirabilota bacterium]|nr:protein kinase [Methylomirabilota bacterium]